MDAILARIDEKKKQLDAQRPLPPELVKNLDEWFRVAFTYASNAIEGNTLSHAETALALEKGLTVEGKQLQEHCDIIDDANAISSIKKLAQKKTSTLTTDDIAQAIFPNAAKVPELMTEFMQWLHAAHDHPIKIATVAHFKLVNIHPFVDGNGRTARLLMNLVLLQNGYPLAIIQKEDRKQYIEAIETARTKNSFDDFFTLVAQTVEKSLDSYLEALG